MLCQIDAVNRQQVSLKKADDHTNISASLLEIQPITLTQNIVAHLGFKRQESELPEYKMAVDKKYINPDGSSAFSFYGISIKPDHTIGISYQVNDVASSKELKYLHELQNLYFFLTGLELSIKEQPLLHLIVK